MLPVALRRLKVAAVLGGQRAKEEEDKKQMDEER